MASTRNKNTRNNYALELNKNIHEQNYLLNPEYGIAQPTQLPGNGLGNAQLPKTELSSNPIEIESFLFGIGATDLTKKVPVLTPELKELSVNNIYEKQPTIVPPNFVASTDNRPLRR
jgi:hypothetical protein